MVCKRLIGDLFLFPKLSRAATFRRRSAWIKFHHSYNITLQSYYSRRVSTRSSTGGVSEWICPNLILAVFGLHQLLRGNNGFLCICWMLHFVHQVFDGDWNLELKEAEKLQKAPCLTRICTLTTIWPVLNRKLRFVQGLCSISCVCVCELWHNPAAVEALWSNATRETQDQGPHPAAANRNRLLSQSKSLNFFDKDKICSWKPHLRRPHSLHSVADFIFYMNENSIIMQNIGTSADKLMRKWVFMFFHQETVVRCCQATHKLHTRFFSVVRQEYLGSAPTQVWLAPSTCTKLG